MTCRLAVAASGSSWAVSAVFIYIVTRGQSIYLAIAGKSVDELQNTVCVQKLSNRTWPGRDTDMTITA